MAKTLNSHSASLQPAVQMASGKFNAGGNPAVDEYPIQGGVEILPSLRAAEIVISSGLMMGHFARVQVMAFLFDVQLIEENVALFLADLFFFFLSSVLNVTRALAPSL